MSWPLVKIGDVCSLMTGGTPKTTISEYYEDGTVPWIVSGDIHKGEIFDCDKKITELAVENSNARYLPKDSVLIALNGQGKTRGTVALLRASNATCNQSIVSINPNDQSELLSDYLFYFLKSQYRQIRNITGDKDRAGLNMPLIRSIEIPLPPLDEQKRIAAILDKADAIRRKRQQAIQLADDFLRSVFLDMFGDPVINQKGWDLKKINSITTDWRGGAPFKPDDFTDEGVNVLHKGAIQRNNNVLIDTRKKTYTSEAFAKKYKKSEVDQNFLAVTLRDLVPSGPSIGLISNLKGSIGKNYILAQGAYGFKCKENLVKPSYLVYLTNNNSFRSTLSKYWVGSTQIHIRTPIFKEIEIPIPPINIQDEFEKVVKKHRTQLNKSLETIAGSEALFNSLSQKAFAGEL